MAFSMAICVVALIGMALFISADPLKDLKLRYEPTPYTSPIFFGWAFSAGTALLVMLALPAIAWFKTYKFSISSICAIVAAGGKVGFSTHLFSASFLVVLKEFSGF